MKDNCAVVEVEEVDPLEARQADVLRELDGLRLELAKLRASRERLVLAADADRRRIERDLHAGVRQHLVSLAVNLQRARMQLDADPAAAKELLEELGGDVQQALDETAQLAQRIYPALLDARGLAAALRSAAEGVGTRVSVDVPSGANYPPQLAATVYLCCLEALEQVGAGARATVTVRDEDRAVGFEVAEVLEAGARSADTTAGSDAGLERLRDRVEAFGGRLAIRSERGRGLHVLGSLPLPR